MQKSAKKSMILPHLAVPEVQHSSASHKHFSCLKAKAKKTPDQVPAVNCNSLKSCCANTRLVITAILVINHHLLTSNLQNNIHSSGTPCHPVLQTGDWAGWESAPPFAAGTGKPPRAPVPSLTGLSVMQHQAGSSQDTPDHPHSSQCLARFGCVG